MNAKIHTGFRPEFPFLGVFLPVFFALFLVIFLSSVIITFILPEQYKSSARVKIERDVTDSPSANGGRPSSDVVYAPDFIPTELEVIKSDRILDRVIDMLGLNEKWQKKYGSDTRFKSSETRHQLRRMIDCLQLKNTSIVEISIYCDDKMEASQLANTIADVYVDYHRQEQKLLTQQEIREVIKKHPSTDDKFNEDDEIARLAMLVDEVNRRNNDPGMMKFYVIDRAEPSARPIRPNKPLNITLGAVFGGMLGVVAGALASFLAMRLKGKQRTRTGLAPVN